MRKAIHEVPVQDVGVAFLSNNLVRSNYRKS